MSDDFPPNVTPYTADCPGCGGPAEWSEHAANTRALDRAQITYLIDCPRCPEPAAVTATAFDPLPANPLTSLISLATWLRPNTNRERA